MQSSKEQQGEIREPSSMINSKKQRKTTKWERLEISSKKNRDTKGIFHVKMGTIKDRNCMDLTEAENPMDGGAWQVAVHGVAKSWIRLSDFTFMHWRRKWQPTPVFLFGESQGWGSLVGCCLWCHTESDTTEVTQQQQLSHWLSMLSSAWRFWGSPVFRSFQSHLISSFHTDTIILSNR